MSLLSFHSCHWTFILFYFTSVLATESTLLSYNSLFSWFMFFYHLSFMVRFFAKCIVVVIIIMPRKQKQPYHFSFHPCPINVLPFHSVIDVAKLNFAQGLDGFVVMLHGIVKNIAWNCQKCWMDLSKCCCMDLSSCNVYSSPSSKPKPCWCLTKTLKLTEALAMCFLRLHLYE